MRRFVELLLDRLSRKDDDGSTKLTIAIVAFLVISGTIGVVLLICLPSSGRTVVTGNERPSAKNDPVSSTVGALVSSSSDSQPQLVVYDQPPPTSGLRYTLYFATGLIACVLVAYFGTRLGFWFARRRTIQKLHNMTSDCDLEASLAKLKRAPQFQPAGSLSADLPPLEEVTEEQKVDSAPRQVQESLAVEESAQEAEPIAPPELETPRAPVNSEIDASIDVDAILDNLAERYAAKTNSKPAASK
jgi:hypothetical protein